MKSNIQESYRLLHEGSIAFADMERAGVRINTKYLDEMLGHTEAEIKRLGDKMRKGKIFGKWKKHFGERANLGSHEQLAHLLFNVMGYEAKEFTVKGKPKTDADALEDIDLPFVRNFQQIQNHKHTRDTYLSGIKREMVSRGDFWYVHPIYNLHTASTYRSSCDHPNFQNVPKRNPEMAKLIRPCYLPHPGHHMAEMDFGQLEVRVAACYTKDPQLIKYINDPSTDMHRDAAIKLFKLSAEMFKENKDYYKKTVRDSAKNEFVFPEFYGSVFFNCAKNIWKSIRKRSFKISENGVSMYEHLAENGIKELGQTNSDYGTGRIESQEGTFCDHVRTVEEWMWEDQYKVYTRWKREWWNKYQSEAGFSMYTGFRVNGVYKKNDVINYPIQGSAFHCLLWCLIVIHKWLKKNRMLSKIIGEIHDSLVLSIHPNELQEVLGYCHHVMTVELPKHWPWIIVPMEVEAEVGPVDHDWTSIKQWTKKEDGLWSLKV